MSASTISTATTCEAGAEEFRKLNDRVKELEAENYQLTREFQRSLGQSNKMLDQVLQLESKNERLMLRINQVKDYVG